MIAFDGNNSLKRLAQMADHAAGDTRIFNEGDYYLDKSFVDSFANEVASKRAANPATEPVEADADVTLDEADAADGNSLTSGCTDNWKAARPDHMKHAWNMFAETGLFASACRHSLILWIVDMIRSGELYI
jgi:hypothetical protein